MNKERLYSWDIPDSTKVVNFFDNKDRNELYYFNWKRFTCFSNLTTEIDGINYILDQSDELKTKYYNYQELLLSIKEKNYNNFIYTINNVNNSISDYMKTSIKTWI